MKCHECRDLLSPYLDNMTSDDENKRITVHLTACHSCYREMQEMKLMLEGIGILKGDIALPAGYTDELHERLLEHKTSLWGKRQAMPAARPGSWIAASIAALALGAGIWMSSFVPYAQVADVLQKAVPAVFDRSHQQVKPEIEKIIADKTKEMQNEQGKQSGSQATPSTPQQVAVVDTTNPQSKSGPAATENPQKPAVTAPAVKVETPKVVPVVAMKVNVENLDTAISLLKNQGESENTTIAVANNDIHTLAAGRERVVSIQVPETQVDEWTNLLDNLGNATSPSSRTEDVTKTYYSLSDEIASLQQQLAAPSVTNSDQLKAQLIEFQKQLQAIKDRLKLVTITVTLHEEVAP
ncbi:MAG: DUF4349 domain-containing protein [Methylocystaceae bacterium]